ncbi:MULTISPECIES: GrpB family protein [Lysinibacillus]|uniref:GrpB family protein n=1 Tax=Lysinibacillus TaxID=400634 RepID=UPI003083F1A9
MAQRRYFQKGRDSTHHAHFYQVGSSEITRHLAFRNYLTSHPDEMKLYGDLKERLAQQFPHNMKSYIVAKDYFAKQIERKHWHGITDDYLIKHKVV